MAEYFTESTIEQAAIDWQEEALRVSFMNQNHVRQSEPANQGSSWPRKPLGSVSSRSKPPI
jgi:hypothetical protein